MSAKTERKTLDVEVAEREWHPFDEGEPVYCIRCADEIELGQEFVWRPEGEKPRMIFTCHASCAVLDGFKLNWPSGESE